MTSEPAWRFWRVRSGRLEGISFAAHLRQTWGPGMNTATTRCSVDPTHEAPAPNCLCGMYVTETLPTAVAYLRRTTLRSQPSTPIAVGAVLPVGPRLPAYPWPMGDPAGTLRVGAAEVVGPLHVFPGHSALWTGLEARYGVPVSPAATSSFGEWLDTLAKG
jgi:hypothetical protein